jgi:imidazolonepropionase
MAQL